MKIERYGSNRRGFSSGCGCGLLIIAGVVIITIAIILIAPALPSIGLRIVGFQPIDQPLIDNTPEAVPVINQPQTQSQTILSAGSYGQRTIPASSAYTIQTGTADDGSTIAQITLSESGIMTVCGQYTDICSSNSSQFRNVTVDLGNNRATLSGEAYITQLNTWQTISAIVTITETNTIRIEGVEVNGTLFGIPDGELGNRIRDIQSTANGAIQQLGLQTNGASYRLSDITLNETQLVATFR